MVFQAWLQRMGLRRTEVVPLRDGSPGSAGQQSLEISKGSSVGKQQDAVGGVLDASLGLYGVGFGSGSQHSSQGSDEKGADHYSPGGYYNKNRAHHIGYNSGRPLQNLTSSESYADEFEVVQMDARTGKVHKSIDALGCCGRCGAQGVPCHIFLFQNSMNSTNPTNHASTAPVDKYTNQLTQPESAPTSVCYPCLEETERQREHSSSCGSASGREEAGIRSWSSSIGHFSGVNVSVVSLTGSEGVMAEEGGVGHS